MKYSIVTAYYNRRTLFLNSLATIARSPHRKDLEIVVVDDASREDQRIEDLPQLFDLAINVVRVEPGEKWWRNPCIPFNIGFNQARGEIILLQNPECLHLGDIIGAVKRELQPNKYLNFACYSIDEPTTHAISALDSKDSAYEKQLRSLVLPTQKRATVNDGETGWYNHSQVKPSRFHFCSALLRDDLRDLGGFDERYANGTGYDDNDLLTRILRKGMQVKIVDDPFVVHQYHGATNYSGNLDFLHRNMSLFNLATIKEHSHHVASRFFPCL